MKVAQRMVDSSDAPETVFLLLNELECPVMKVRICGNWCHGGRHVFSDPFGLMALFKFVAIAGTIFSCFQ